MKMLARNQVLDPPELGFDVATIEAALKQSRAHKSLLDSIVSRFNSKTSTPLKRDVINWLSFCKETRKIMASKIVDNDSGYVSNHQESNSTDFYTDMESKSLTKEKFVYMNEDALLEKPTGSEMSVLEDSVSCEEECFPGLRDSVNEESGISDKTDDSPIISNVSPIIITKEKYEIIIKKAEILEKTNEVLTETNEVVTETSEVSIESNDCLIETNECLTETNELLTETNEILTESNEVLTETKLDLITTNIDYKTKQLDLVTENCDNDSNAENNLNYLNVQSRAATLLSLPIADENKHKHNEKDIIELRETYENVQLCNITQTPDKAYKNPVDPNVSPDLFSDDDLDTSQNLTQTLKVEFKEKYVLKQDRKLYRRAKEMLIGVPPPVSLQYVNLTVAQMLERYEENKHLLLTKEDIEEKQRKYNEDVKNCDASFLISTKGSASVNWGFPQVLEERYHGLHYNRSKLSEEMEQLAMQYASKYIGCETHSSCTVFRTNFPSSPSKGSSKLRWAIKSPGKRLSHLARRRITFSSANLQSQTRQIAVDPRRLKLLARKKSSPTKSPRKTPKKSPMKKIKTPTSSAKKKLSMQLRLLAEQMPSTSKISATKRALFQSPEKVGSISANTSKILNPNLSGNPSVSPFRKRTNLKCVLFASPTKSSPSKNGNKRKRTDSESIHPNKLPRTLSLPETSENKPVSNVKLVRVKSEVLTRSPAQKIELSETHKKKLLWAIYEALRGQKVPMNHPQYKQYAAILFRVTKKFLPDLSATAPRPEGGTSERMLRIARQHVGAVLQGKSVDEIVREHQEKRLKSMKPSGYVPLEDAKNIDISRAKENVLKDRAVNQIGSLPPPKLETKKFDRIDKVRKVINFDGDKGIR